MNPVISRTWSQRGVFYRRRRLRTVEGSIIRKLTIVLWLPACLTLIGCGGPCPNGTQKRTFGYCKTCANPASGPEFGQILACSWNDALKELYTGPNILRCKVSPANSSDDCRSVGRVGRVTPIPIPLHSSIPFLFYYLTQSVIPCPL